MIPESPGTFPGQVRFQDSEFEETDVQFRWSLIVIVTRSVTRRLGSSFSCLGLGVHGWSRPKNVCLRWFRMDKIPLRRRDSRYGRVDIDL